MIHTFIGNLGHLFVMAAFVSALVAATAYILSSVSKNEIEQEGWRRYARFAFYGHALMVLGIVGSLFYIIYNHFFEYHYAWSHSSLTLPVYYMISSFWEGQEGSFLLWIFWHVILGLILIGTQKKWEVSVMAVFAMVQAFLTSMILGVVIGDVKIGSSPFILLRDAMEAPVFAMNPDFVPEDGTGLNPLLQNYWMVIHPPTMFLGFAATLVPFAFCIAGLWRKKYAEWVKPALPWALFAAAIIGIANVMGAYWAYETLNFGGYWNWDPVENAIYIPWLILIGGIHTMIIFKNNNTALKTSIILIISTFILVLYATFLTRSGILGNTSVHSFTDLGLSGQLLLYLLFFTAVAVVLSVINWKYIPTSEKEASAYSREFWIFMGATTLCLMSFQVLIPTSIPVFNAIVEAFGGISNMAPPADQVAFYTKFQLWFGVAVAILSGTGQFFFWRKMDKEKLMNALTLPLILTLIVATLIIAIGKITNIAYIVLLTAGLYALIANTTILVKFVRNRNFRLSGGSVTHIGIAMMLLGILFSAGYSKVVSLNNTGLLLFKDAPDEMNQENILLWFNEPRKMKDYELVYKGDRTEVKGVPGYVDKKILEKTNKDHIVVAQKDWIVDGKRHFSQGDTLEIYPENTYHEVVYTEADGNTFTLFPRSQVNPNMGLISSPDIRHYWDRDLYTHVSAVVNPEVGKEWSEPEEFKIQQGERFFVNDYVAVMEDIHRITEAEDLDLQAEDIAVQANVKIYGETEAYTLQPIYLIRDRMVGRIPDELTELGIRVTLMNIHPETDSFTLGVETTQKDYVVMKAIEFPFINILWTGTILMALGFGIAMYRRFSELGKTDKKEEVRDKKPRTRGRRKVIEA